jgi:hypothetical protein
MFKKKMEVSVEHVVLAPGSSTIEVQVTQTFRSGGYADVGQKRLILVPERNGLHILAEDMLESQALAAPEPVPQSEEPAEPRAVSASAEQTAAATKIKNLTRRLRSALRNGDMVTLKQLLPPNGLLDIEIKQCIGDTRTCDEEKRSWTRSTLTLESFKDIHEDEDLKDECFDEISCDYEATKYLCRGGCGGYLGSYWWQRAGDRFYLTSISFEYD